VLPSKPQSKDLALTHDQVRQLADETAHAPVSAAKRHAPIAYLPGRYGAFPVLLRPPVRGGCRGTHGRGTHPPQGPRGPRGPRGRRSATRKTSRLQKSSRMHRRRRCGGLRPSAVIDYCTRFPRRV
jgi:hypothetical protein